MARAGDVGSEASLSSWFRRRRDKLLRAVLLAERRGRDGPFRVLDIGGDAVYWRRVGAAFLAAHRVPFFHWLPQPVRAALLHRWRMGLWPPQPDIFAAHVAAEFAVPLDRALLAALFPDARLVAERVAGWPKSWIALRTTQHQPLSVEEAVEPAADEHGDRRAAHA